MTALNEFKCLPSYVTFSSAPYSATVPEHAPLGSNVLVVECEDVDRFEGVVVSFVSWTCSTKWTLLIRVTQVWYVGWSLSLPVSW